MVHLMQEETGGDLARRESRHPRGGLTDSAAAWRTLRAGRRVAAVAGQPDGDPAAAASAGSACVVTV